MNSGFCKYADIFGKPGTGLHSFRLYDFAVVDVLLTVALGTVEDLLTKIV
jgi:hypothetical protein